MAVAVKIGTIFQAGTPVALFQTHASQLISSQDVFSYDVTRDGQRFLINTKVDEPDPIARKAFYLLKRVLADRGLRAIGKIVLRDREQLVALDPFSSTMLLSTLYWPDEVRSTGELTLAEDEVEIKPGERAMAEQLVATMTAEFDPAAYRDEYREALMAIIEAKAAGSELAEPTTAPAAGLTDLMAALEASVAAARAARETNAPEPMVAAAGKKRSRTPARVVAPAPVAAGIAAAAEAAPVRRRKSA
jgi:DNA end-binding protein Ku